VRDLKIDILRTIGILLVILAHVKLPELVRSIRSFDVVMLVFISGMSFAYSKPKKYTVYIANRVRQLLVPTYITLTIIFAISAIVCSVLKRQQLFDVATIISSYFFLDSGIGYVWIAKAYMLLAIASPLLNRIVVSVKDDWQFIFVNLALYVTYYSLIIVFENRYLVFTDYLFYLLPYSIVFMLGMRCVKFPSFINKIILTSTISYCVLQSWEFIRGNGFNPNTYKFPPRALYLLYGITLASILYKMLPAHCSCSSLVRWISKRSFSIYLVHIIVLFGVNLIADLINISLLDVFLIEYAIVLISTLFIVHMIDQFRNRLRETSYLLNKSKALKNNREGESS